MTIPSGGNSYNNNRDLSIFLIMEQGFIWSILRLWTRKLAVIIEKFCLKESGLYDQALAR